MKAFKQFRNVVLMFAIAFIMTLAYTTIVKAAPAGVPTVKQIDADFREITIEWNDIMDSAGEEVYYYVMYSTDANFTNYRAGQMFYFRTTTYTISELKEGTTYYVKVGVSNNSQIEGYPADTKWSASVKMLTTPDEINLDSFKYVNAKETSISVSWNPVFGATAYQVRYHLYDEPTDTVKYVVTTTNSVTITGLAKNTFWTILIYPIRKDGECTAISGSGCGYSNLATLPTKVTGVKCDKFNTSVKKGEVKLSWDNNKVAEGYQYEIYKYNDTKCKKKLASGYTEYSPYVTVKNSKLKERSYYKVRVRAYVKVHGKKKVFGKWSNPYYFTRCAGNDVKEKLVNNKIRLSWKKVDGAQSYTVYWAKKANGRYTKLTTTKKTNYTINKKWKYNQKYYVRIVPNRKVGKTTYKGAINGKGFYSDTFRIPKSYS